MAFRLFRRPPLPDPVPPLRDYWATVRVTLYEPLPPEDDSDPDDAPAQGFFRIYGIRADPAALRGMIESEIFAEGTIVWDGTTVEEIDPSSLKTIIRKRIEPVEGAGIWYRSGHVYFADTE